MTSPVYVPDWAYWSHLERVHRSMFRSDFQSYKQQFEPDMSMPGVASCGLRLSGWGDFEGFALSTDPNKCATCLALEAAEIVA